MELSSQVTNLELSKKLKELGVKQGGLFSYIYYKGMTCDGFELKQTGWKMEEQEFISAFTISELLELLPYWLDISKSHDKDYMCRVFEKNTDTNHHSFDENPCNALAKMLIHLIENKLLEI